MSGKAKKKLEKKKEKKKLTTVKKKKKKKVGDGGGGWNFSWECDVAKVLQIFTETISHSRFQISSSRIRSDRTNIL